MERHKDRGGEVTYRTPGPLLRDVAGRGEPLERVLDALTRAGCSPRAQGRGWQARCPAHEDRNPSLAIARGDDGRVLLRCWSGCGTERVLAALELSWPDLFQGSRRRLR